MPLDHYKLWKWAWNWMQVCKYNFEISWYMHKQNDQEKPGIYCQINSQAFEDNLKPPRNNPATPLTITTTIQPTPKI